MNVLFFIIKIEEEEKTGKTKYWIGKDQIYPDIKYPVSTYLWLFRINLFSLKADRPNNKITEFPEVQAQKNH